METQQGGAKLEAIRREAVVEGVPVAEVAPVAEAKALTKDEVMSALIDFIGNHEDGEEAGEEALGVILKELGNFTQFPEVPADKYADLLTKINQA